MTTTLLAPPAAPEADCPHERKFATPQGLVCHECLRIVEPRQRFHRTARPPLPDE